MPDIDEKHFQSLVDFFNRDVCQKAAKPLREGIAIAIYLAEVGPITLTKREGNFAIVNEAPKKPELTFWISAGGITKLTETEAADVGEVGVAILQLMANADPNLRMKAKVHIGLFELLRNGYLAVLPMGGPAVMKFLASKGFTGMGKIKDAISHLKE